MLNKCLTLNSETIYFRLGQEVFSNYHFDQILNEKMFGSNIENIDKLLGQMS